ncbi:MAG: helix-turn-helix domain-containing protein, partial [Nitrospirae bacterium]|nr:helix-turn-helix domain-containing protein [Nitrospirota bacterium]MDE3049997.1 IS30 family transposase [Nitrospirota bacterium]
MSAEERETLSLGLARGHSLRTMATVLRRAPSTVSREHARNARRAPYRACTAHTLASARARQPRRSRKLLDPWLWQYVRTHLAEGCSPEQIAGRLQRAYPDDMGKQLSAETIYAGLYVLPRGTLRSELLAALRQARKARRPRARGTDRRGQIPNMTPIAERCQRSFNNPQVWSLNSPHPLTEGGGRWDLTRRANRRSCAPRWTNLGRCAW